MHALEGLREQVLVGHRDERHGHAGHRPDLGREHAAGVDDDVGADLATFAAMLHGDAGDAALLGRDRHDAGVGVDGRALGPRTGGEGLRQAGRIEPAVGRQVDGTKDTLGRHEREQGLRLVGPDEVQRQAERLGPAGLATELLVPFGCRRQAERSDLVPRRIDAGLRGQPAIQVGAVHHHPGQGHRSSQLTDQPGGVEGRARSQLRAIDQDDVGPAALCQVVRDGGAAHAAADDHRSRALHPGRVAAALGSDEEVR